MALFSQDDSDEDETPNMGTAFSGAQDPDDPDAVSESPVPEAVDQADAPAPASPDDANAYAQSPDEEHGDDEGREAAIAPDENGGAVYGESASTTPQDSGGGGAQLPAMPQYVDNLPNYQALEKEISNFKPSDYKPSIGRRIAAALSGGAVAFGSRNPAEGIKVAEGVDSAPLDRARATEQQQEQATRQQIADVNAQNQTRQTTYQNQRQAANDAALNEQRQQRAQDFRAQADARGKVPVGFVPDDKDNPYAGGTVTLANGSTVKGPPPDKWLTAWERDPANKAKADAIKGIQTLKSMRDAGIVVSPENAQIIASGGHVTPAVRTSISIEENPDGSARTPGGQNDPQTLIAQHLQDKQSFADGWQRVDAAHAGPGVPEGSYVPADTDLSDVKTGDFKPGKTNFLSGQQFNDKIDKFRTDLNAKPEMQKAGIGIDHNGNVTRGGSTQPGTQAAPVPAKPATPVAQDTVPMDLNGSHFAIPKTQLVEGRSATDDKGKKWVVSGGKLVPGVVKNGKVIPIGSNSGGGSGPPNPQ